MRPPPVFVPRHQAEHTPVPAPVRVIYAPPAPPPRILAMIASVAGILVALSLAIDCVLVLVDLPPVASSGVVAMLVAGLLLTGVTAYASARAIRGGATALLATATLLALSAAAITALLSPPRDRTDAMLAALARHASLAPLRDVAVAVAVFTLVAAIVTMVRGRR